MAVGVEIDVEVLRCEIKKTYARVSQERTEEGLHIPNGARLGARPRLPARAPGSRTRGGGGVVCGRGESDRTGTAREGGEVVLDVGSGAGTDSLVAAQMVAPTGRGAAPMRAVLARGLESVLLRVSPIVTTFVVPSFVPE